MQGDDAASTDTAPPRPAGRRDLVVLTLLALVMAAGTLATYAAQHRVVVADEARFTLEAVHVWDDRRIDGLKTTLDRFGGPKAQQPGPMVFYAAHPFVRALGLDLGARAFALTVGLASIGVATWAARRTAGRRAGLAVFGAGVLVAQAALPGALGSSLNPDVVVLPTFATIVLAWALARGLVVTVPALVLCASFVGQTHVGYSVIAGLGAATGLGLAIVHRDRWGERWRRPFAIGAAVAVVLWAPTVYDQLFRTGNLGILVTAQIPHRGLRGPWEVLGPMLDLPFRVRAERTLQEGDLVGPGVGAVLPALLLGAALWRTRTRLARSPEALVGLATVVGALVTAWLTPPSGVADYELRWVLTVAVVVVLVPVLAVWSHDPVTGEAPARSRPPTRLRLVAPWLVVSALVLSVAVTPPRALRAESDAVRELTAELRAVLPADGPVVVLSRGGDGAASVANGVVTRLRAAGLDISTSVAPDTPTYVVTWGAADVEASGPEVATWEPAGAGDHDGLPDRIAAWVRASGQPIVLTAATDEQLADRVDGSVPTVCLDDLRADPDRLAELPAPVLAALYRDSQVTSPRLPDDLTGEMYAWSDDLPVQVRRAPSPGVGELVLSRSSC